MRILAAALASYADTGIYGGDAAAYTANITALAKDGITLSHHYVHWHCSPTRRTFLSGVPPHPTPASSPVPGNGRSSKASRSLP